MLRLPFFHKSTSEQCGNFDRKASCQPTIGHLSGAVILFIVFVVAAFGSGAWKTSPARAADPESLTRVNAPLARSIQRQADSVAALPLQMEEPPVHPLHSGPLPPLSHTQIEYKTSGGVSLPELPSFSSRLDDRVVTLSPRNDFVFYTIDSALQDFAEKLVARADASHVAVVVMNPKTGAVLAMANKSRSGRDMALHAGFPAASLFKVVTATAAIEQADVRPTTPISFRGGTYTLESWNYLPDARRDKRTMTIGEAMGRSCNPVFGHIGLQYLNPQTLHRYAKLFGFNRSLGFEVPLTPSSAQIPVDDQYEFSRTSAGFGEVTLSPVHAAAVMSGIANGGLLPRPTLIDKIVSPDGRVVFKNRPEFIQRMMEPATSQTLLEMMRYTTTEGTSRRAFMNGNQPVLGNIEVVGKTGTLRGENPEGLNNWFIGAAPIDNPKVAIAVVTVDAAHSAKSSMLARALFSKFFNIAPVAVAEPAKRTVARTKKQSVAARKVVTKKSTKHVVAKAKKAKKYR